jgi:hypothetical protein
MEDCKIKGDREMTGSIRLAVLALFASGLSALTAVAATNVTFDVAARLGYQTSDQDLNGEKIAEWSAPLVGVEGTLGFSPSHILKLEGRCDIDTLFDSGKLYTGVAGGSTDYTGRQWRLKGEGDAGLVLGNSDLSIMPFAGFGYRIWSWSDPNPDFTHIDSWSAVYGLVGVRGDVQIDNAKLYGRFAAQIPVRETVSTEGYDKDIELHSTSMVEAELGMVTGRLLLGLWGEWFKYHSDNSYINETSYTEDIRIATIGVKIGLAF